MPHPWSPGDPVDVKIGNSWCFALVSARHGNRYECTLQTPVPCLQDVGITHRFLPGTTELNPSVRVNSSGNSIAAGNSNIRDHV